VSRRVWALLFPSGDFNHLYKLSRTFSQEAKRRDVSGRMGCGGFGAGIRGKLQDCLSFPRPLVGLVDRLSPPVKKMLSW